MSGSSASSDKLECYLPEPTYFAGEDGVSLNLFLGETFRCLAQWATRYDAHVLSGSGKRSGPLPDEPNARNALIEQLVTWLLSIAPNPSLAVLNLTCHHSTIWDQHDGIPGPLWLTQEQFADLQGVWENAGLPNDLYYPMYLQHIVVEASEQLGSVIRSRRVYSPRQWLLRGARGAESLEIPDEQTRMARLVQECDLFRKVLLRRLLELSEPGRQRDTEQVELIGRMLRDLADLEGRNSS